MSMVHGKDSDTTATWCRGTGWAQVVRGPVPLDRTSQLVADVTCVACLFAELQRSAQRGLDALADEHEGDVRQAVHQVRDLSTTLLLGVTRW